jgi:hypothetical protein
MTFKSLPWQGRVAVIFLLFAVAFNLIHYSVFGDANYIFKFLLAQLGFLPISVYLVTVVVNELLGRREKQAMLKKLNMVIGSFFSEVGTELLRAFSRGGPGDADPPKALLVNPDWGDAEYRQARTELQKRDSEVGHGTIDWPGLRAFLSEKRHFLLSLLGNPNLLEHETFTELLWAVFHLAEELGSRRDVSALSASDSEHLVGDIRRVYVLLGSEWLSYMRHLQEKYPYLFSLAVRTNPFHPAAIAEVA